MSTTAIDPVAIAKAAPGAPGADPSPEQLRMLAAQFESLLMTQMMNAMRQSMFDENDEGSGFAKGPLADALYSELSLALSRAGGLGLSDSIMAPLMRQAGTAGAGDALSGALATPLSYTAPDLSGMMPSSTGADSSMGIVGGMPAGAAVAASLLSHGVTSQYGWRQDPIDGHMGFHKGTDIAMPVGRDVPAAQAGEVSFAGERNGYGRRPHGLVCQHERV
jgi:murein DD-endopeptidase MepM/ murein hydrolase activator NlpD